MKKQRKSTTYIGTEYEKKVAKKMRRMWWKYWFVKRTGKSGDYGADVQARTFPFCRKVVVQCKCYTRPVPYKAVSEIIAARELLGAHKAILATNTTVTKDARVAAEKANVELWENFE